MLDKHAIASRKASNLYSLQSGEPFHLPESVISPLNKERKSVNILFDGDNYDLSSCREFYTSEDFRLLQAILPTMSQEERALFLRNHSWEISND